MPIGGLEVFWSCKGARHEFVVTYFFAFFVTQQFPSGLFVFRSRRRTARSSERLRRNNRALSRVQPSVLFCCSTSADGDALLRNILGKRNRNQGRWRHWRTGSTVWRSKPLNWCGPLSFVPRKVLSSMDNGKCLPVSMALDSVDVMRCRPMKQGACCCVLRGLRGWLYYLRGNLPTRVRSWKKTAV